MQSYLLVTEGRKGKFNPKYIGKPWYVGNILNKTIVGPKFTKIWYCYPMSSINFNSIQFGSLKIIIHTNFIIYLKFGLFSFPNNWHQIWNTIYLQIVLFIWNLAYFLSNNNGIKFETLFIRFLMERKKRTEGCVWGKSCHHDFEWDTLFFILHYFN